MRDTIAMACTGCETPGKSVYWTIKNRKNDSDRIEQILPLVSKTRGSLRETLGDRPVPMYEYAAAYCLDSLFCPKRFVYRQSMNDAPRTACEQCGTPLERVLSSFSAGSGMIAHAAAASDPPSDSEAPPPTMKNIMGGGLGIRGCGHAHD